MALAVFALTLCKESLSAQVTNLFIGSEEAVIKNGLKHAQYLSGSIAQKRGGLYYTVSQDVDNTVDFTSKEIVDTQATALLKRIAQGAIDNNAGQNKDGEFIVVMMANRRYDEISRTLVFLGGELGTFRLVKTGGIYSLPDLSGFVMGVPVNVSFPFPNLAWGRVSITNESGVRVIDSVESSDPVVDLKRRAIILSREDAMSGRVSISVIYGANKEHFAKFDVGGHLVPEDPPIVDLTLVLAQASGSIEPPVTDTMITVRSGDIGRSFKLQKSSDFNVWTDVPNTRFSVRYTYPYLDHQTFTVSGATENSFFRLMSENKIPVYEK
jgi:hypothetical protein